MGLHTGAQASDVALCASGTAALELAVAGVPAVVVYKTSTLTAWAAALLAKVRCFAYRLSLLEPRRHV